MSRILRRILSVLFPLVALLPVACELGTPTPRPAMPVRVSIEPHIPDTLELGVHLKLENLLDESVTVLVEIDSDALRNSPDRDDLSMHPIFRADGPVEVSIPARGKLDFWFTREQLSPEDPVVVTHERYAAQLVRVPVDAGKGPVEAIAIGPVE